MNNIIQNIPIEDIILNEVPNNNKKEIDELSESIKKYGIVEPLLVREKNNKYEIIAGKKRYQAALKVGLKEIPVLIRNIENDFYQNKKTQNNKFINPFPKKEKQLPKQENNNKEIEVKQEEITNPMNYFNRSNNSDIINLSELNKEENERDELNMNNEILNNQGAQPQNTSVPQETTTPTFGGRFFPSLEDEPTNMNMGGMNIIGSAMQNATPVQNVTQENNNLIDLTTEGNEMDSPISINNLENPVETPEQNMMPPQQDNSQFIPEQNNILNPMPNMPASNEPIPQMQPEPQPINQVPNNFEMANDSIPQMNPQEPTINTNTMVPPTIAPQFDMSQSMTTPNNFYQPEMMNNEPVQEPIIDNNIQPINEPENISNDYSNGMNQTMNNPLPEQNLDYNQPVENNINMPINDYTNQPEMPMINNEFVQEQQPEMNINEPQQFPQKDVTPVLNTIKALTESLKSFGYNINIAEEDLGSRERITIDIEK